MAFPDGWSYRKSITLSRASGAVTNYQMKVLVGESSGATGEDVDCGGLCATDFDDLRFTNAAGTLLDYWIESVSGTTPNQLATVWVECDSIGTGATTFYMYYGNAGAAAYSNGADTFLFFDHFDGDLSLWTTNFGSPAIGSSKVTCNGTANERVTTTAVFGTNTAFRVSATLAESQGCGITFDEHNGLYNYSSNLTLFTYRTDWGANTQVALGLGYTPEWHIYELRRNASTDIRAAIDDIAVATNNTNFVTTDAGGRIGNGTATAITTEADWALVRQWLVVEPAWGSWGAIELTGWSYRKSFALSRASGAVTDYQMKVLVGESAGATGEEVDCGGLCNTDFSDLRFTNEAGTLLDYWIESVSGATPNQLATVWVECDSIDTGATTFYMYYGNAGAASASSGDDTFLFFDDFNDASVDAAKWTNSGTLVEGSGTLSKYAANTNSLYLAVGKTNIPHPCVIATRAKVGSDWANEHGWNFNLNWDTAWSTSGFLSGHYYDASINRWYLLKYSGGTPSHLVDGAIVADTYYKLELKINDSNQYLFVDGSQIATISGAAPVATNPLLLGMSRASASSAYTTYFDYAYARKWVADATEPAWGAWGAFELTGWSYRKSFTFSRASGAVTNYQMKIKVGESSGAAGEDVDCGGLCKTDFSDLRFTNSAGTLLDYYIEDVSGATPNQLATIWIEFDSIGTGATTFYMYYGNADATAVSNGPNTFVFFEDFNALNTADLNGQNGWSGNNAIDVVTTNPYEGAKHAASGAGGSTVSCAHALSIPSNGACFVQARIRSSSAATASVNQIYMREGTNDISAISINANKFSALVAPPAWVDIGAGTPSVNTWYKVMVAFPSASTHKTWVNDTLYTPANVSNMNNISSTINVIRIEHYIAGGVSGWDQIMVGYYLDTGPALGSWGAQEGGGGGGGIIVPIMISQYRRRWAA